MVGWHHRLNGHGFGKLRELVMDREAWHAAVPRVAILGPNSQSLKRVIHSKAYDGISIVSLTKTQC